MYNADMVKRSWNTLALVLCAAGLAFLLLGSALPGLAAPPAQFTPFPTPTPGPDGRIVYIVQSNDSWWRIAAVFNIDLDQLLEVNAATRDTVLVEGKEILLGFGGPSEVVPTLGPSPTPAPQRATPTAQPGSGSLCVLVYNDQNGDSIRQEEETSIPGAAISIADRSDKVSLTGNTTGGLEPTCFADLPQGEYNISVAVPEGFNPTTLLNYALQVDPGAETYLDFGAQVSSQASAVEPSQAGGGGTLLLGIAGGLLLLGGIGLGVYAGLLTRNRKAIPEE
jgi:hypothetical protein